MHISKGEARSYPDQSLELADYSKASSSQTFAERGKFADRQFATDIA